MTWVTVGRIRGAYGVDGACRVFPYSDVRTTVLRRVRRWRLVAGSADGRGDSAIAPAAGAAPFELPIAVSVRSAKVHGDLIIARLAEPLTREQAEALRGCEIQVDRADFPPPDEDEYYWSDLIGCRVESVAGESLGVVADLDDHGGQLLLRLDRGTLIPFVAAIVVEVDVTARRIVADWSADWL
ncbi:MAG: ribosome maturation factor RimM [Lautropia sp.]